MNAFLRQATAAALWTVLLVVTSSTAADAKKLVVGNCNNETELRTKLAQLQIGKGGTLKFHCGATPPPIVLTGGALPLYNKVKIDGGLAGGIEISGGNASPIFAIDTDAKVTLKGLTLSHGLNASSDGGAITNSGKLTIERCLLTENKATVASGGAIVSYGRLTILRSELSFNKGANGGAVYPRFAAAKTTIVGSQLHDNQTTSATDGWGGAILIWDGASVDVRSSEIVDNEAHTGGGVYVSGAASSVVSLANQWRGNSASVRGGAIYNQGHVTLDDDVFEINEAGYGGAIDNDQLLTADTTGFDRNHAGLAGGAIYNTATAQLTASAVTNSTMGSSDSEGGGIYNTGAFTLNNVTLSGNAAGRGGALSNAGSPSALASLLFVTIFGNAATSYGGGIDYSFGTVTVVDSIVAGSTQGLGCDKKPGSSGVLTSNGFNLSSDASCPFDKVTDFTDTDPGLGPLAFNGGATRTHMPLADSKALDNGLLQGTDVDQRQTHRPQGAASDIGAVERCGNGKPGAFALLEPAAGAEVRPGTIFDWSDASCATSYTWFVRVGSSTGQLVFGGAPTDSLIALEGYFGPLQTYVWQVTACNRRRCRTSEWRPFTLAYP